MVMVTIMWNQHAKPAFHQTFSEKKGNAKLVNQWSPNPQPNLHSPVWVGSNGGHPQREGTNLGVLVPLYLGVFDLCHFAHILPYSKGAVQIRVGLELADIKSREIE